jgi:hypothetical protein
VSCHDCKERCTIPCRLSDVASRCYLTNILAHTPNQVSGCIPRINLLTYLILSHPESIVWPYSYNFETLPYLRKPPLKLVSWFIFGCDFEIYWQQRKGWCTSLAKGKPEVVSPGGGEPSKDRGPHQDGRLMQIYWRRPARQSANNGLHCPCAFSAQTTPYRQCSLAGNQGQKRFLLLE